MHIQCIRQLDRMYHCVTFRDISKAISSHTQVSNVQGRSRSFHGGCLVAWPKVTVVAELEVELCKSFAPHDLGKKFRSAISRTWFPFSKDSTTQNHRRQYVQRNYTRLASLSSPKVFLEFTLAISTSNTSRTKTTSKSISVVDLPRNFFCIRVFRHLIQPRSLLITLPQPLREAQSTTRFRKAHKRQLFT